MWLWLKVIETKWDFEIEWQWRISKDREIVYIKRNDQIYKYKREYSTSRKYVKVDQEWELVEMDGCIGKINNDNNVIIYNLEQRTSNSNNSGVLQSIFSSLILEHIKNKTAIAVIDAAIEGEYLATV